MPESTTVIRFLAPVIEPTVNRLFQIVDECLQQGTKSIKLLVSSPGGNVIYGVSAYNFLRGLPIDVRTHNFGSVDSIGVVLFCAGKERLSVSQGRFLLHDVGTNIPSERLFLPQLQERVRDLEFDRETIASVFAETSGQSIDRVKEAMQARTVLNSKQAKDFGFVHGISNELVLPGENVISIHWQQKG